MSQYVYVGDSDFLANLTSAVAKDAPDLLKKYGPKLEAAYKKYGPKLEALYKKYGPKLEKAIKKYGPAAVDAYQKYGPKAEQYLAGKLGKAPAEDSGRPKWAMPVAIGAGALGLLLILKR